MRPALLVLCIALQASPAFATGSLSCEGQSGATSFQISSGISHTVGLPLFGFGGELATGLDSVSPDMRNVEFSIGHLAQWWQDGEELNLKLAIERSEGPAASIQLTIKTHSVEDGLYEGSFTVEIFEWTEDTSQNLSQTVTGTARCMSE